MTRILLTGATGFIGRQAIEPLRARGFEVHAVARRRGDDPGATWHEADLLDPGDADGVLAAVQPSHLLHFAWFAAHREYWTSAENVRWVEASLRLVRRFHENGGTRIVIAGTCAEYDWDFGWCTENVTPLRPRMLYGAAKNALREVVEAYPDQSGLSSAWGRIFFTYGPYEHPERLVSSVARALVAGEPAPTTHGGQIRDFLHVADVANAFAALVASDVRGAVNIGTGEPRTIASVVEALARTAGHPELLRLGSVKAPIGEPPLIAADVRRLREQVGWAPSRTHDERLAETLEWWRKELRSV